MGERSFDEHLLAVSFEKAHLIFGKKNVSSPFGVLPRGSLEEYLSGTAQAIPVLYPSLFCVISLDAPFLRRVLLEIECSSTILRGGDLFSWASFCGAGASSLVARFNAFPCFLVDLIYFLWVLLGRIQFR